MGDNRRSASIWLGLTAVVVQLLATWVGYPEGDLNQGHYMLLGVTALLTTPLNVAAIGLFAVRTRPDIVVTVLSGMFLAWHVLALVLLTVMARQSSVEFFTYLEGDRTLSTWYQAAQVAAFSSVLLTSITAHARQSARSRRPARM